MTEPKVDHAALAATLMSMAGIANESGRRQDAGTYQEDATIHALLAIAEELRGLRVAQCRHHHHGGCKP